MEQIGLAIIIFITGLITTVVGWVGAHLFGVGPAQDALVKTLQNVVNAQAERIKQLEEVTLRDVARIGELEARVKELEDVILRQSIELSRLDKKFHEK